MGTEVVKPSKIFYGISVLILLCGIIGFIVMLITGINYIMESISNRVIIPGISEIELEEEGKYSIYFEYESTIDGKRFETVNINGLICSLKNKRTGEFITLNNASVRSNYSMAGRAGYSIFDFIIKEAGEYELQATYESGEGEEAVLAIGKGFGMTLVRTILLSLGVLFACTGTAIIMFVVTLLRRKKGSKIII